MAQSWSAISRNYSGNATPVCILFWGGRGGVLLCKCISFSSEWGRVETFFFGRDRVAGGFGTSLLKVSFFFSFLAAETSCPSCPAACASWPTFRSWTCPEIGWWVCRKNWVSWRGSRNWTRPTTSCRFCRPPSATWMICGAFVCVEITFKTFPQVRSFISERRWRTLEMKRVIN